MLAGGRSKGGSDNQLCSVTVTMLPLRKCIIIWPNTITLSFKGSKEVNSHATLPVQQSKSLCKSNYNVH